MQEGNAEDLADLIELEFGQICEKEIFVQGDKVIIGYLAHDTDCESPMHMCDSMGKILSKSDETDYLQHISLQVDGDPDLGPYIDIVCRFHNVDSYDVEEDDMAQMVPVAKAMWEVAFDAHKAGTRWARALYITDYGHYNRAREWERGDSGLPNAVWIPDQALIEELESRSETEADEEAERTFQAIMKEYNLWLDGDCYGVVIQQFLKSEDDFIPCDEVDSTWGYIGRDYAIESLNEAMAHYKKELSCTLKTPSQSSALSQTA
jgi:hypothetical protein